MTKRLLLTCVLAGFAVPAAAQAQTALVFFEVHSARLDDAAEAILGAVSMQARATGAAVEIRGYADPEGGAPYNRALSLARAEHVAHVLRESGVEPGRLRIVARGPTDFTLDSQESRRVEIRLAP
jgi:OOP family OmpA-OmpF porin